MKKLVSFFLSLPLLFLFVLLLPVALTYDLVEGLLIRLGRWSEEL